MPEVRGHSALLSCFLQREGGLGSPQEPNSNPLRVIDAGQPLSLPGSVSQLCSPSGVPPGKQERCLLTCCPLLGAGDRLEPLLVQFSALSGVSYDRTTLAKKLLSSLFVRAGSQGFLFHCVAEAQWPPELP